MKNAILVLVGIISLGSAANARAAQWQKIISCRNADSTFVADQDAANPESVQFVIEGSAAAYVSNSMRGNSISYPKNLHIYDNGNKIVISDLSASKSINPSSPDPYVITANMARENQVILSWMSGSENYPMDRYGFYNCR